MKDFYTFLRYVNYQAERNIIGETTANIISKLAKGIAAGTESSCDEQLLLETPKKNASSRWPIKP